MIPSIGVVIHVESPRYLYILSCSSIRLLPANSVHVPLYLGR